MNVMLDSGAYSELMRGNPMSFGEMTLCLDQSDRHD